MDESLDGTVIGGEGEAVGDPGEVAEVGDVSGACGGAEE